MNNTLNEISNRLQKQVSDRAQAAARIAEETEQAIKEVEQRVNKELNIRPETETDKAYKSLLGKILK